MESLSDLPDEMGSSQDHPVSPWTSPPRSVAQWHFVTSLISVASVPAFSDPPRP